MAVLDCLISFLRRDTTGSLRQITRIRAWKEKMARSVVQTPGRLPFTPSRSTHLLVELRVLRVRKTAGSMQQKADTKVPDMSQQCCTVEEDVVSEGAEDVGGPAASTTSLLGLPESIVLEILGNLGVLGLGRASCSCRCLRDACADERLWVSLWEGPLPEGFDPGGKAAHAALWLLAKGSVQQTRVVVSEPVGFGSGGGGGGGGAALSAHGRRWAPRRRVSDVNLAIGGGPARADGAAGERGEAAGFPVHVSCIAIRGGFLATAAGQEITVWDLEEDAAVARFNVSGHGSVTYLLLHRGTLLAGDNSGYLRSYIIGGSEGHRLREVRAHTDRVTVIDDYALPVPAEHPAARLGGDAAAGYDIIIPRGAAEIGCRYSALFRPRKSSSSTSISGVGGGGRRLSSWGAGFDAAMRGGHGDHGDGWGFGGEFEGYAATATAATERLEPEVEDAVPSSATSTLQLAATMGGCRNAGRGRGQGRGGRFTSIRGEGGAFGGGGGGGFGGLSRELNQREGDGGGRSPPPWMADWEPARLGKRQGYAGRGQGEDPRQLQMQFDGDDGEEKEVSEGKQEQQEEKNNNLGWGHEKSHSAVGGDFDGGGRKVQRGRREEKQGGLGGGEQTMLFTGSDDGTAKAWDAVSGKFIAIFAGHSRGVTSLQATSTESYGPVLVTGGGDSAVIIWELLTGMCLERLETGAGLTGNPNAPGPRVGCLQAYGDRIVVGEDRHVSVWSLAKGERPTLTRRSFCEHQRPIRRLAVVGRWIVTCSGDYIIRFWDSTSGLCIREMPTKTGAAITSFRLSGLCLLTTSLFDSSVLMTRFLPRPS